ncbi:MAG: glycosyl transferase [Opitutae bacterium]|nr:glycosyl transferase [Opitutae bacterium]
MSSFAGRLFYQVWHRPIGAVILNFRAGGLVETWRTARGRAAMTAAARQLPAPVAGPAAPPVELFLLTGKRFWEQTAFCLWTFARHSGRPLRPVIYDDGSLGPDHRAALARLFPATQFVPPTEAISRLDEFLPAARFPTLRDRWQHYPNIRKLIDPHLGSTGWKLVLDSDLLFFRRPDFILDWCDRPRAPLHAVDCETSYGYPRPLLDSLAGAPLADLVNVGLTGLNSGELDWERLEHWCRTLIEREGTSYYLEQALIAMLVAGRPCAVAPAADYVTLPRPPESAQCRAVMHHYVADSKPAYFRQNWRTALARTA